MTLIWLIVWLVEGTPSLHVAPANAWAISLGVCALIDVLSSGRHYL